MSQPVSPSSYSSLLFTPSAPAPNERNENFDAALEQAENSLSPSANDHSPSAREAKSTEALPKDPEQLRTDAPWLSQWLAYVQPAAATAPGFDGEDSPSIEAGEESESDFAAETSLELAGTMQAGDSRSLGIVPQRTAADGVSARSDSIFTGPTTANTQQGKEFAATEAPTRIAAPVLPLASAIAHTQTPPPVSFEQAEAPAEQDEVQPLPLVGLQGANSTSHRTDIVIAPGASASLHGQALQGRMDEALRWMAAKGIQTAHIRVDPESMGPITVHLRIDGEMASVVFASNHEQTRHALEQSLAGLKSAMAESGFSLEQASVGSEQQSGFLSQDQHEERIHTARSTLTRGIDGSSIDSDGSAGHTPAIPVAQAGRGMVDLYA